MANPQNLNPPLDSNKAREIGKKGGSTPSPARDIALRKYCEPKCNLYPCWAIQFCEQDKKGKNLCFLKKAPEKLKKRTIRLLTQGETGFNAEITDLLLSLVKSVEDLPTKSKKYNQTTGEEIIIDDRKSKIILQDKVFNTLIKAKDSIHGIKNKTELTTTKPLLEEITESIDLLNNKKKG